MYNLSQHYLYDERGITSAYNERNSHPVAYKVECGHYCFVFLPLKWLFGR